MRLEVLLSCMNQNDFQIVEQAKLQSDVLLINQNNEEGFDELIFGKGFKARMIYSKDRGLSKSRNLAIANSDGDICLLADDDEIFYSGYRELIIEIFTKNPEYDIIGFIVDAPQKKYPTYRHKINYLTSLRMGSCQIAFRREAIRSKGINFNENFGSGTENGPGEENLFLYDCLKAGLKILYVPLKIGKVSQNESNWFKGFDEIYFINRGKILRELMGRFFGTLYAIEFAVVKYPQYKKDTPFRRALPLMLKSLYNSEIS